MGVLHGNRVGLEPRRTKHGHKSHILFCGIPILCRLPSLWCPLTHLSITKLTVSYQTCSEWFHLPLWKLAMRTVAGWSHPGPKSREVSWPTGRPYQPTCAGFRQTVVRLAEKLARYLLDCFPAPLWYANGMQQRRSRGKSAYLASLRMPTSGDFADQLAHAWYELPCLRSPAKVFVLLSMFVVQSIWDWSRIQLKYPPI